MSISECDTEISFSGAGMVKIPEGVGVFDVETHLGFKGTIECLEQHYQFQEAEMVAAQVEWAIAASVVQEPIITAPKKYKLLCDVQSMEPRPTKDSVFLGLKAGDFVWDFKGSDGGVSAMDSKILGVRCLAVTDDLGGKAWTSMQAQYLELV